MPFQNRRGFSCSQCARPILAYLTVASAWPSNAPDAAAGQFPGFCTVSCDPHAAGRNADADVVRIARIDTDGMNAGKIGAAAIAMALTPGRHHIEIRAAGYQTLTIDSDVLAGQVIPYQGQMQPSR